MHTPAAGSDETAVDDDGDAVAAATFGVELLTQDLEEQRDLIARLKAERAGSDDMMITSGGAEKREREDEEAPLALNIKEPEKDQRLVVTNSRVRGLNLDTKQKSFAWGVAAFAVGFGAITYLPNFL